MPCVFCGAPKTTKEHVFPRWLRDVFPEGVRNVWTPPQGSASEPREWGTRFVDMTARIVCADCNNGWMARLESSARPHLEPLMRGNTRTLDADARHEIAYWGLKTALATDLAKEAGHQAVPAADFAALNVARDVLPETHVWLGQTSDADGGSATHRAFNVDAGERRGVDGWHASLHIGHLVIHVTHIEVGAGHMEFGGNTSEALQRVWPQDQPITWPPEKAMTRAQIQELAVHVENSPMILIPAEDDETRRD